LIKTLFPQLSSLVIDLRVRRLVCSTKSCPRRTFREQVPALTSRWTRRTVELTGLIGDLAVVVAGRAGSAVLARLGTRVSRSTVLRVLMAMPVPPGAVPTVLSVDDFNCAGLNVLAQRISQFAGLLTGRRGEDLDAWMTLVDADDLPSLHGFVHGLRMDLEAVVAGLTLPYSNGPMEGANTKVKLLKRQMYGRAGFALRRQRILLA
jgi:hypothetical protein